MNEWIAKEIEINQPGLRHQNTKRRQNKNTICRKNVLYATVRTRAPGQSKIYLATEFLIFDSMCLATKLLLIITHVAPTSLICVELCSKTTYIYPHDKSFSFRLGRRWKGKLNLMVEKQKEWTMFKICPRSLFSQDWFNSTTKTGAGNTFTLGKDIKTKTHDSTLYRLLWLTHSQQKQVEHLKKTPRQRRKLLRKKIRSHALCILCSVCPQNVCLLACLLDFGHRYYYHVWFVGFFCLLSR